VSGVTMQHLDSRQISRAAAGELSEEQRSHLSGCADCRRAIDHERARSKDAETEEPTRRERVREDTPTARRSQAAPAAVTPEPAWVPPPRATGSPELARGTTLGRYLLLDMIGQGGMGSVYAAYDAELDRKVAIKVLKVTGDPAERAEGQARLLREAQALARVSHPNVVPVYDAGTVDERVFLAMEFIEGETLYRYCKRRPPWHEVVASFVQAGRGLAAVHASGLVHRDFKPENVLVGKDGRLFVTDFGLARLTNDSEPDAKAGAKPDSKPEVTDPGKWLASPLTQAGTVMGTPSYMSPEQHLGKIPDARSDQFSFCAALYWAIWGKRPFEPKALAKSVREEPAETVKHASRESARATPRNRPTVIIEPPKEPRVPPRIRRAILRGLSISPDDRFPTMAELLEQFELAEHRISTRWLIAAVALLVIAVGGAGYVQHVRARAQLCSGAPKMLAGAWDREVRDQVDRSFGATGSPFATARLEQLSHALDSYAGSWAAAHRDACEATRIRGEQTETVFALRTACLDQRLKNLRELTRLLRNADAALVDRSAEAALSLPSLRPCSDVAALATGSPLPSDPAARAKLGEVQELLAHGKAFQLAGRYPDALNVAKTAYEAAGKLDYPPLLAESLLFEGSVAQLVGNVKLANDAGLGALTSADVGKADSLRVQADSLLAFVASQQGKSEEGHRWVALGTAALKRMGGDQELEAELLDDEGTLLLNEGRNAEALEALRGALQRYEASLGKDSPTRLNVLGNLEQVYVRLGQGQRAIAMLNETISSMERLRGKEHPALAPPWANLADAYAREGQFAKAHDALARALAIAQAHYGAKSPRVASFLDLEGTIFQEEKRYADARTAYQRALDIKKAALSPKDPDLAYSLEGVGHNLLELGRPKDALPLLEQALAVVGADPEELASIQFGIARALGQLREDRPRARDLATQAEKGFRAVNRPDDAAAAQRWLAQSR
jgi:serine/threonine protein kinase/tetratricopeptide (TPR) repeat protein